MMDQIQLLIESNPKLTFIILFEIAFFLAAYLMVRNAPLIEDEE